MNGAKIRLVVTFIVFLPSKRAVGRRVGRLAAGRAARAQCRPEFRRAHTPRHHHPPAATMVYESDFYTTRRPYRPVTSTYSTSRRSQVDWEKVPFVPRPSLVPEPVTAWGKRRTDGRTRPEVKEVLRAARAAAPPPEPLTPLPEYESARDATRRRVMVALQRYSEGARDPPVDTPRHYVVEERLGAPRRAEENYSYSYNSTSERRSDTSAPYSYSPYSSYTPASTSYSSTTERRTSSRGGPGESYSYSSERSSRLGGPGSGYSSSYSSTTSGRLPHGTTYRHYSYRV